jgi:general secretion pathway protein B
MSYILDALKKLEHEKSRKNRASGMSTISGALFESERPTKPTAAGWKIALAVVTAVLLTFGVTWYVFKPASIHEKPAAPVATIQPPSAPVRNDIQTPPTAPPAVPDPAPQPPAVAVPAAPAVVKAAPPRMVQKAPPSPTAVLDGTAADDAAARLTMQELRKRTRDRQGLTADQMMAAPADIKLSGIAWQEERRARRAVVNGFLMQEGGVVSGARITDIFQDRVRFSMSGKVFEIPLVSAAAPAGAR